MISMYTLLPEDYKKGLVSSYRKNALTVLLFFITFSVAIGVMSLVPAYINMLSKIENTNKSLVDTKAQQNASDNKETENKIKIASDLLSNIKSSSPLYSPSSIITGLSNNKGKGISISSFELVSVADNLTIVIDGKANTRENLVAFKNRLANMNGVTKVELPISALAQSKDINFHIKIDSDVKKFSPTTEVGVDAKPALVVEIPAGTTTPSNKTNTKINTATPTATDKVQSVKQAPKSLLVQ